MYDRNSIPTSDIVAILREKFDAMVCYYDNRNDDGKHDAAKEIDGFIDAVRAMGELDPQIAELAKQFRKEW